MTRDDDIDKEGLKQGYLSVIEEHQDEIIALGKEAYKMPELGYKESGAGKPMGEALHKLGLKPETGVSYTGCRVSFGPKGNGSRVTVMGELGCVMYDVHPDTAEGGPVHTYGHNVQLTGLYGAALGILTPGIMERLGSAADSIAIPAEECVDYEYRNRLMNQGTIHYLGGKQELMCCGGPNDADTVLRCHVMEIESGKYCILDTKGDGLTSRTVHSLGRVVRVGFAPEQGINTLNMAGPTMNNTHALRGTFRDEDRVRVSVAVKEDSGLVSVMPERVITEIMVRASTINAMEDTSHKVNRSTKVIAMALEGKMEIYDCISYLPLSTSRRIARLCRDDMVAHGHVGKGAFMEDWETADSTDLGDIPRTTPCMYIRTDGIKGGLHTEKYRMGDLYTAYIVPAKMMALTIIDLLWDGGVREKEIVGDFRLALTKEGYLNLLRGHQVVDLYGTSGLQSV